MRQIRLWLGALLFALLSAIHPAVSAAEAAPAPDGDLIDRLETLLDKLEPRFWTALGMAPDSSGYREAREMVLEVGSTGRRIQQLVTRSGNRELPNITGELVSLQNLFTQTRRSQAQSYRYRFELTGMAQYEREFRRLASQRGEKLPRNAKPTLENVSYDDYADWLTEICSRNLDRFYRIRNRGKGVAVFRLMYHLREILQEVRETIFQKLPADPEKGSIASWRTEMPRRMASQAFSPAPSPILRQSPVTR